MQLFFYTTISKISVSVFSLPHSLFLSLFLCDLICSIKILFDIIFYNLLRCCWNWVEYVFESNLSPNYPLIYYVKILSILLRFKWKNHFSLKKCSSENLLLCSVCVTYGFVLLIKIFGEEISKECLILLIEFHMLYNYLFF